MLTDREILLGITGGVAAYKSADLASKLVQAGAKVTAVMTPAAGQFIGKTTFEALTGRPVYTDMFDPHEHHIGEHIGLARRADVYVIAPTTANTLAKLMTGIADDLVSTLALAVTCPVLIAPSMNSDMWDKPAVQRNLEQVKTDGVTVIEPAEGWLSCRATGKGRMAEPTEIIEAIEATLKDSAKR